MSALLSHILPIPLPHFLLFLPPALLVLHSLNNFLTTLISPLRSIPGPFAARFTHLYYLHSLSTGQFHTQNIILHAKYGPIVRVAPNTYSLSFAPKEIYSVGSKATKSAWYKGWKHPSPQRWTLFTERGGKRHAEARRTFQGLYALSSLVGYEGCVDACAELLVRRLSEVAAPPACDETVEPEKPLDEDPGSPICGNSGRSIDLGRYLQCYAFDVIGSITYGRRFGFLDAATDVAGAMAALDRSMVYSTLVGVYAWLHPYLYKVLEKLPSSGAQGRSFINTFAEERIRDREAERGSVRNERTGGAVADGARDGKAGKGNGEEVVEEKGNESRPRDVVQQASFLDRITEAHERDPAKVSSYNITMMCISNGKLPFSTSNKSFPTPDNTQEPLH